MAQQQQQYQNRLAQCFCAFIEFVFGMWPTQLTQRCPLTVQQQCQNRRFAVYSVIWLSLLFLVCPSDMHVTHTTDTGLPASSTCQALLVRSTHGMSGTTTAQYKPLPQACQLAVHVKQYIPGGRWGTQDERACCCMMQHSRQRVGKVGGCTGECVQVVRMLAK